MGQLSLPTSGLVYLDTSILIFSIEKIEPYASLLLPLWSGAQAGQYKLATSELTILETLVKPIQKKDKLLETLFRQLLLNSQELSLHPITLDILEQAVQIRAMTGLKTPDAIHAATALNSNCNLFLTNDFVFKRITALNVTVLEDVLAS